MPDQMLGFRQGEARVCDEVHVQLPKIPFDIGVLCVLGLVRGDFLGQVGKKPA